MNLRTRLILYVLILSGLWLYARGCDRRINHQVTSTVLPKNDTEKIIVNPAKHTLHIIHPSGPSETLFLPDRPSSIEIQKNGKVKLTVRAFGTEVQPFIGFAYSDTGRLALGADLAYFHKFDLGVTVFPTVSGKLSVRVGPVVSYNVYNNTSLFLGCTNTLTPIGGIELKF